MKKPNSNKVFLCLIVLAPDFMTKIGKKSGAVSKVFDRVKIVALWSAKINK